MATKEITSGVLFADVCNSTGLYKQFSTKEARALILEVPHPAGQVVMQHQGEIVDRIGDEIMCRFPEAHAMVEAAIAMQKALEEAVRYKTLPYPMHLRIGCHFGLLVYDNGSIFGDTVHTARRLASVAKADQILTSREVASTDLHSPNFSTGVFINKMRVTKRHVLDQRDMVRIGQCVFMFGHDKRERD